MNYGVILASGIGTRMNSPIPKQFMEIESVPIIIYTIRSMLKVSRFDYVYVVVKNDYVGYMQELITKHIDDKKDKNRLRIVEGGVKRIDSIYNVTNAIFTENDVTNDDIIVIHDAVRPFVPERVLHDSIDGALMYNAVVAVIPVVDTIICSEDGQQAKSIPVRSSFFFGQSPDSFRLKYFKDLLLQLTEEQKKTITGTSQICSYNNQILHLIRGDEINFKITTVEDINRARVFVQELQKENKNTQFLLKDF